MMEKDELVYLLKNVVEVKRDLIMQLREFEKSGEFEDVQNDIKIKLDIVCGIEDAVRTIEFEFGYAIEIIYLLPNLFNALGSVYPVKPKQNQFKLLPLAIDSLLDSINANSWSLTHYYNWRTELEKFECVMQNNH